MTNYSISEPVWRLHDLASDVDAMVASGDCFITLATRLDEYNHQSQVQPGVLEPMVRLLLELQRRYKIVAKPADYRQ